MPLRSGWKWQRRSRREGSSAVASPATAHRRAETPWFRGTPADGQPSLPGSPRSARKAGARSHACSRVETGHAGGHSPAGGSDGRGATGSSLSALPGWNKAAPRPSVAHRGRRGGDRALVAGSRAEVRERQDTGAIPDWISAVNLLANVAAAGLLDTVSAPFPVEVFFLKISLKKLRDTTDDKAVDRTLSGVTARCAVKSASSAWKHDLRTGSASCVTGTGACVRSAATRARTGA